MRSWALFGSLVCHNVKICQNVGRFAPTSSYKVADTIPTDDNDIDSIGALGIVLEVGLISVSNIAS